MRNLERGGALDGLFWEVLVWGRSVTVVVDHRSRMPSSLSAPPLWLQPAFSVQCDALPRSFPGLTLVSLFFIYWPPLSSCIRSASVPVNVSVAAAHGALPPDQNRAWSRIILCACRIAFARFLRDFALQDMAAAEEVSFARSCIVGNGGADGCSDAPSCGHGAPG